MSCRPVGAFGRRAVSVALAIVVVCAAGCALDDDSATTAAEPTVEIVVAAASDLRLAFDALGDEFTDRTGNEVTFSFGSSGQLKEQIINGAPFDLFASANVEFVDDVIESGRGDAATKADYAYGRLALWSPPGVMLPPDVAALTEPRYRRIAIANPEHAPYGIAAQQALVSSGVHDRVSDRLVLGENISDTLRIAESGNADVGIVALSLVITADTPYNLVSEDLHEPLRQALVVTSSGARGEVAADFAAFVNSDAGRRVMVRHGFALPGERSGS